MTEMIRAHKIKLNPTPEQIGYFRQCAGIARHCWNWSLAEYQKQVAAGEKPSFNEIKKAYRAAIDADFPFVRSVASCVIDEAVRDLSRSISTFFKSRKTYLAAGNMKAVARLKFPSWRKRRDDSGSFAYTNIAFSTDGNWLHLGRLAEPVNMTEAVRFPGKLMGCRVTQRAGEWFASITVETEQPKPSAGTDIVGVHFGLRIAATISDGRQIEPPRFLLRAEHRLTQLQRGLSKKVKGSANWQKQKRKIGKAYLAVANQRADFQHKLTTGLIQQSSAVAYDKWGVQELIDLPDQWWEKDFYDAGVATIAGMLDYKGSMYGVNVIAAKIKASKICSTCGEVNELLKLSQKKWGCPNCGAHHDREINAALNNRKHLEAI